MVTQKADSGSKLLVLLFVMIVAQAVLFPFHSACGEDAKKLAVYTVNYPLKYFAERIAGDHASVVFPAPADGDPAFWMPDTETIAQYQKADFILLNGAAYAKWVPKVTLPQFRLINTSAGFEKDYIEIESSLTHSHGPGGEHSHAGTAFTTWLDFSQAAEQARMIMEVLGRKRPEHKKIFQENFESFEKELLALDKEIEALVSKKQDQPLVASHPVYQYFARRYQLNLESVMWEPDEVPAEKLWAELEHGLEAHPAKWMIWEGEPLEKSVERLASMGVGSIVFDPCGNTPEDGDFMSVMRSNINNLKRAFE